MKALAILIALTVSGCTAVVSGGVARAFTYDSKSKTPVNAPDGLYNAFDHKSEMAVMTALSTARAAAAGAVYNAGVAGVQDHQVAAEIHLKNTGRGDCTITRASEIARVQYEFFYTC